VDLFNCFLEIVIKTFHEVNIKIIRSESI